MMKNKLILGLLLLAGMAGTAFFPNHQGYHVGDVVSDFSLKNVDGKMFSLNDLEGVQGCIVVFTCNHCPFSVAYEDRIIALNKEFAPKGYPVVAINPNDASQYEEDSYDNMIIRAKEKGFNFPYVYDETQKIAKTFGATRTPHVFVLRKNTVAQWIVEYIGAIDNNVKAPEEATERYVENAVNTLLTGNHPEPNYTASVGCTIKWKKS